MTKRCKNCTWFSWRTHKWGFCQYPISEIVEVKGKWKAKHCGIYSSKKKRKYARKITAEEKGE